MRPTRTTLKRTTVSAPTKPQPQQAANGAPDTVKSAAKPPAAQPKRVAPVQMTGAQALVRSLEELGVDDVFGIPGGAILPVYDPLFDSKKLRHILVRHEQGAGHAARATRRPRARSGCASRPRDPARRTSSPRSPTPTWTRCRWSPITGQVVLGADRDRRLPGGRHLRHHDADHQAQLPGSLRRRHPAGDRRGVPHRGHRPPRRRCWSTSPRTCCRASARSSGRRSIDLPGYRPVTKPHGKQIREAAKLIAGRAADRCSTWAAA